MYGLIELGTHSLDRPRLCHPFGSIGILPEDEGSQLQPLETGEVGAGGRPLSATMVSFDTAECNTQITMCERVFAKY